MHVMVAQVQRLQDHAQPTAYLVRFYRPIPTKIQVRPNVPPRLANQRHSSRRRAPNAKAELSAGQLTCIQRSRAEANPKAYMRGGIDAASRTDCFPNRSAPCRLKEARVIAAVWSHNRRTGMGGKAKQSGASLMMRQPVSAASVSSRSCRPQVASSGDFTLPQTAR